MQEHCIVIFSLGHYPPFCIIIAQNGRLVQSMSRILGVIRRKTGIART